MYVHCHDLNLSSMYYLQNKIKKERAELENCLVTRYEQSLFLI